MSTQQQNQRRASDRPPDQSARAPARDITDSTSTQPESETRPTKRSFANRLSTFLKPKGKNTTGGQPYPERHWKAFHPTNVGLHLTQDPHPETNLRHRMLPEEHRAAHEEAQKMAQALQEQHMQPPRELRGPVPRNRVSSGDPNVPNVNKDVSELRLLLDLDFLTPIEKDVLHRLRRTRRCSHFHPVMEPREEILLVHSDDTATIRQIQDVVRPLPEKEKQDLAADLYQFLTPEKNYMLKLLLFNPEIRVTTNSRGQGLGMEAAIEGTRQRRDSKAISSYLPPTVGSASSSRHTGDVRFQDKPVINKTFEVKSERISTLRGGGGDTDSIRSSSTYFSALSGTSYGRLEDDQRVPKLMWWLAGGRGSSKGKQPTAKEMRERRKAEVENGKQVGFLGTVLGIRAPRPKRTEVEEYPADEQQDSTAALEGEPEMSGALPPPSPPPAPELEKSLPPTPEPTMPIHAETPAAATPAAEDVRSQVGSTASQRTTKKQSRRTRLLFPSKANDDTASITSSAKKGPRSRITWFESFSNMSMAG